MTHAKTRRRWFLAGAALFGLTASSSPADMTREFTVALDLLESGRTQAALPHVSSLADRGFAPAQTLLGTLYLTGRNGLTEMPSYAAIWYYKAALKGYPPAQLAFARLRWAGVGIAADAQDAFLWASLASQLGRPEVKTAAFALRAEIARDLSEPVRLSLDKRVKAWRPERSLLR